MKIVFWDLETTDLKGLMGRLLCCSFCTLEGEIYTFRADDKAFKGRSRIDDSVLAEAIRDELHDYHMIVGWNSKLFDRPFLNARLMKAGLSPLMPQFHLDLMYYARGSSTRVGSSRLVNVQKFLNVDNAKTEISWEQWQQAGAGDKDALDEVVHHCEQDVLVLRDVYPSLLPYVSTIHR